MQSIPISSLVSLALLFGGLSSSSAQQVAQRSMPLTINRLVDTSAFTGAETLLDFEGQTPNTPFTSQEISIRASEGYRTLSWIDAANGRLNAGPLALHLAPVQNLALATGTSLSQSGPTEFILQFQSPITRVGFEVRHENGLHANMLMEPSLGRRSFGTAFFDVAGDYGFCGLESSRPFRSLRIFLTNPSNSLLSLDNLRFELDDADFDGDGVPDFADVCPTLYNPMQEDRDGDLRGDLCDPFPDDFEDDADGDGVGANLDNCPATFNPGQLDSDGDGIGDLCDTFPLLLDSDGDGVPDVEDNCPDTANPDQLDCDNDGIGDVYDLVLIEPAAVARVMQPGESFTFTTEICLSPAPGLLDLMLVMDTTGSMGGEINLLRMAFEGFALSILNAALPGIEPGDVRIGLANHEDDPLSLSSPAPCPYSAAYGGAADLPFELPAPLGTLPIDLFNSIQELTAVGGIDAPESHARVLWELAQEDSGVGFRPEARRVVILATDEVPHDCNVDEGIDGTPFITGPDVGRDGILGTGDDLDLQADGIQALIESEIPLFTIFSGTPDDFIRWEAFSNATGGSAVQISSAGVIPDGVDIAGDVLALIEDPIVDQIDLIQSAGCDIDIVFDPISLQGPFDVSEGLVLPVEQTITFPAGSLAQSLSCEMDIFADGLLIGTQTIDLFRACEVIDFEGLANGEAIDENSFATQGVTISLPPGANLNNFGACAFDSTSDGPNAGGPDPDLLVNEGNLLILQENNQQSVPGFFDEPDDAQLGGFLFVDFEEPSQVLSIDFVDVDDGPEESIILYQFDTSGRQRQTIVPAGWTRDLIVDGTPGFRTLDLVTPSGQPGFLANAGMVLEDPGFDRQNVRRLVIDVNTSTAIDNIVFCKTD